MPTYETNTRKIIKRLKKEGWYSVGGSKHDKFRHTERENAVIVPRRKEQTIGVAETIAKGADWV